jgi:hypothetical protein
MASAQSVLKVRDIGGAGCRIFAVDTVPNTARSSRTLI